MQRRLFMTVGVLLAISIAAPAHAEFTKSLDVSSNHLVLRNLIGEVTVKGHGGSSFEVKVAVKGKDATESRVQVERDGDAVNVIFPLKESRKYVYPRLGNGSRSSFSMGGGGSSGGWLSYLLGRGDQVEVRGSGSGLELWADVEILVPRGSEIEVYLGAGKVFGNSIDADVNFDTSSGGIEVDGINGDVILDTGSGRVIAANIRGDLNIDTGSGGVEASNVEADDILIDTGSGRVTLDGVIARSLEVDTGSGGVEARNVEADEATIDTGSGSVTLELTRMGSGRFDIDTGSGGIKLLVPGDASADVTAETGSGGISVDIEEGVQVRRMERDEAVFSIGGGGSRVRLSTGSGGIRVGRSN